MLIMLYVNVLCVKINLYCFEMMGYWAAMWQPLYLDVQIVISFVSFRHLTQNWHNLLFVNV